MAQIYSQRDARWKDQRLGTVDGTTIGGYGCYVSSLAMTATHAGIDVNPAQLDDIFTERGLYVNGNLCTDDILSKVYPQIRSVGAYHCESFPCDLNQLLDCNGPGREAIIEVDFNHNPNDGTQTHFVRFVSYDPSTGAIIIDDPWYGTEDNFALHYGTDPSSTIQKIVKYDMPVVAPAPAPAPAPEPAPAPVEPAPVPEPAPVEAPAPEPVVVPDPVVPVIPDSPLPPAPTVPDTAPIVAPVKGIAMNKFLSRKFLLTVLAIILAVGGVISGALTAGESLLSVTFITSLFVAIQGAIDHANAGQ